MLDSRYSTARFITLRDGPRLSFYHYQMLVVNAYHMALCTSNKKTREKAVAFKNHTHLFIGTPAWVLLRRRNEAEKTCIGTKDRRVLAFMFPQASCVVFLIKS